ncbi:MAG: EpsG family protein [Bacteroidaceae bacterium]|nr:EpsG family protein [Bacteroidaceae bacterium]
MAKTGGEKWWYYSILVLLILFAGLRYRVGSDTLMYMSMFDECPKLDELKYFDFETAKYNPFWYIINAISRSIYDDFTLFQIIHATIVNSIFFWFFRKYCPKYYFTAILLYYLGYFCYFNMEIMRESLSICVLLLSTSFFLNKRWVPYFIMSAIGILIHYSAAIMIVLPLFYLFRRPSWKLLVVIFLSIIVIINIINLPELLLGLLGLNQQLIALIESYLYDDPPNAMGMLAEILKFLPILGMIWLREKHEVGDRFDFTPLIMGTVIFYAIALNFFIFGRFNNYFVPYIIIYIVNTIYYILNKEFRRYQISYMVGFFAFFVFLFNMSRFYTKDMSEAYPNTRAYIRYLPYYSVFNPVIDEHRERFVENDREVSIEF